MKKRLCIELSLATALLVVSLSFVFPQTAPINEAQLQGLPRTYTARQVYDVIGLPACATDPPTGACTTKDTCVDDTNDELYTCIATAWESLSGTGGGGGAATAIQSCAADPPVGACTEEDVCVDDTNLHLYICEALSWAKTNAGDADTLDTLDSLAFLKADASVTSTGTQTFSAASPLEFSNSVGGIQTILWGCDTSAECIGNDPTLRFVPEGPGTGGDSVYQFQGRSSVASLTCSNTLATCIFAAAEGNFTKLTGPEWEAAAIALDGDVTFEHAATTFLDALPVVAWGDGTASAQTFTFTGDSAASNNAVKYTFDNKGGAGTAGLDLTVDDLASGFARFAAQPGVELTFSASAAIGFLAIGGDINFTAAGAGDIVRFNLFSSDNDTQFAGDTDLNLLYLDAGNDRVGIGDATPATKLEVNGTVTATAFAGDITGNLTCTDCVALTSETSGNYVDDVTASQGLLLTGTEGATLGLVDCAANEVLKRNGGDTAWACASDLTGGSINSFETMNASSGTDPVADSATDTLLMTGTLPVLVTGNSATDELVFSVNDATGAANGVVRLAGDLSGTAAAPTVVGVQANAVALSGDTTGNYAAGDAEAGNATGVACSDCIALTTETSGNYVSSATASQGLLLTGTEGATLGFIDCAANEVLKRNVGDTAWECAADAGGSETNTLTTVTTGIAEDDIVIGNGAGVSKYTPLTTGALKYDTTADVITQAALADLSDVSATTGTGSTVVFNTGPAFGGIVTGAYNLTNTNATFGEAQHASSLFQAGTGVTATQEFEFIGEGESDNDELFNWRFTNTGSGGTTTLTVAVDETDTIISASGSTLSLTGDVTCTDCIALTSETSGDYLDDITASQGLLKTGTEGATVGLIDCAANQILKRNAGDTLWECAADAGGGGNSFETWDASSGTDPVADSATDTMIVTGTLPIVVTGDVGADSLTFSVNDATGAANGIVRLAGDLGGTAASPTVTGVVANAVALTTDTTGTYVSTATANQGLLVTGTEGASVGFIDCAANQIVKRNGADTQWICAADATVGGGVDVKSGTINVTEGTPGTVTFGTAFSGTPFCTCTLAPGGTDFTCWQSTDASTTAVSWDVDNSTGGSPTLEVQWICTDAGDP